MPARTGHHARRGDLWRPRGLVITLGVATHGADGDRPSRQRSSRFVLALTGPQARDGDPSRQQWPIVTSAPKTPRARADWSSRPGSRPFAPATADPHAGDGDPSRRRWPVLTPALKTHRADNDRSSHQGWGSWSQQLRTCTPWNVVHRWHEDRQSRPRRRVTTTIPPRSHALSPHSSRQ